jgi:D-alanyl-D-alanine carboxypeptidase
VGNVSLTPPSDLQQNELVEIDALKEQLQAAIREMEVECSVQRAKLSHERARLEAREADLQRREKKLVRDSREQLIAEEKSEPLVSRIKGMLRRS